MNRQPRIAVVGAGLGGLAFAYELTKHGLCPVMYEASDRVGGRIWTQTFELGAEKINTNHAEMFRLAKEMGLRMIDCEKEAGEEERLRVDGNIVDRRELEQEFKTDVWKKILKDIEKAGGVKELSINVLNAHNASPYALHLDSLSAAEYLETLGMSQQLKKLFTVLYGTENGKPLTEQSALNFLQVMSSANGELLWFGASDERYTIEGGNGSLTEALATHVVEAIGEPVRFGHRLVRVQGKPDRGTVLTFRKENEETLEETFDIVALNIPLHVLARDVDLEASGLSEQKREAIRHAEYGKGSKIMLQTSGKPYRKNNQSGSSVSAGEGKHGAPQVTWDGVAGQKGDTGVLVRFAADHLPQTKNVLACLDTVYEGMKETHTGNVATHDWNSDPNAQGTYFSPGVGHYAKYYGALETPDDSGVFFVGEAVNNLKNSYGFMNDAAQSGTLRARDLVSIIGGSASQENA